MVAAFPQLSNVTSPPLMGGVKRSQGTAALSFTKAPHKKCHRNLGLMFAENMSWGGGRREEEEQEATSRSLGLLL